MNVLDHSKLLQLAAAYENPREMIMVMEYIGGGELFEKVVADDFTLTERDCVLFMRQVGLRVIQGCQQLAQTSCSNSDNYVRIYQIFIPQIWYT
jgi:serine/threonine protein kinase